MVKAQARWSRAMAFGATAVLAIAACSSGTTTPAPATQAPATEAPSTTAPETTAPTTEAPSTTAPETTTPATEAPTTAPSVEPTASAAQPTAGGTLYLLMSTTAANGGVSFQDMDPQRIYTGEDLAFFSATMFLSLTSYQYSTDPVTANSLQPDAATDIGTPNADGTEWSFTLRDGMTWQDGSAVNCEDFKYGASRTFATSVITNGPTYAIQYLDIPTVDGYAADADGKPVATTTSAYGGPYDDNLSIFSDKAMTQPVPNDKAAYDAAVSCDGNTITYKLNHAVPDFNYTVTLGFDAVPNPTDHPGADTGENYTNAPWSDGPYMIDSFSPGVGGSLVLVRNPNWVDDGYRPALPDKWEVDFAIDPKVLDQRLMQPNGNDVYALQYGAIQPENLNTIFVDPHTAQPDFTGRAFSDYDPYSRYYWIRTDKVTNVKIRQAMAVALDRDAIRAAGGGEYVGDFADGVVKPNIGQDYAPTHLWDAQGPFGEDVPDTGDPALATQLIADSGEAAPTVTWDYVPGPVADQIAAIVQSNLQDVGFTVNLNPISEHYYSVVQNPDTQDDFGGAGWGPDWPNASTVIPPLFTDNGGFNLSRITADAFPDFYNGIQTAATTLDRSAQATQWQQLNTTAADNMFVIPTFFGLTQTIAGTQVGSLYKWAPYGSWPYAQLYVEQ